MSDPNRPPPWHSPHAVTGGPDQPPPPAGTVDPVTRTHQLQRRVKTGVVIGCVVVFGTACLVFYLVVGHFPTTAVTPLPDRPSSDVALTMGEDRLTKAAACIRVPAMLAEGDRLAAAARTDWAAGRSGFPSVDRNKLQQYLATLASFLAESPARLQSDLATYTSYFIQLQAIQVAPAANPPDPTAYSQTKRSIQRYCA